MTGFRMTPLQNRLLLSSLTAIRTPRLAISPLEGAVRRRNLATSSNLRQEAEAENVQKPQHAEAQNKPIKPRTGVFARSISVFKVPSHASRSDCEDFVKDKGFELKDLRMKRDRFSLQTNGAFFVELDSEEQADLAVEKMNRVQWNSKRLKVKPMPQDFQWDEASKSRWFNDDGKSMRRAFLPLIERRRCRLLIARPGWGETKIGFSKQIALNKQNIEQSLGKYGVERVAQISMYWGGKRYDPNGPQEFQIVCELDFETAEGADKAIAELSGTEVAGRVIQIEKSMFTQKRADELERMDNATWQEVKDLDLIIPNPVALEKEEK